MPGCRSMLKFTAMPVNELYLAVLPLMRMPTTMNALAVRANVIRHGAVEQVLTLFPDKSFATQFYPDEVEFYVVTFTSSELYLTGGHVLGYEVFKEPTEDGRVIVRVVQHVG